MQVQEMQKEQVQKKKLKNATLKEANMRNGEKVQIRPGTNWTNMISEKSCKSLGKSKQNAKKNKANCSIVFPLCSCKELTTCLNQNHRLEGPLT